MSPLSDELTSVFRTPNAEPAFMSFGTKNPVFSSTFPEKVV